MAKPGGRYGRVTSLVAVEDFLLTGDENGDLVLRDLLTNERLYFQVLPTFHPCVCTNLFHGSLTTMWK